uniref:Coiled-coil domain-containing protein 39 n=1 Tax=Mesocestoides corti TaxID=53468 RepID=A0A5K3EYH3_MESCO
QLIKSEKEFLDLQTAYSVLQTETDNTNSQLKSLKCLMRRCCLDLSSRLSKTNQIQKLILLNKKTIQATCEDTLRLKERIEQIFESKLSISQLQIETEKWLRNEEKNTAKLTEEIERFCKDKFRVTQERMAANSEKLRLQSVIRGDKIELKNLDVLIRKEEEKMANKEHIIYDQALKIFQLESRIDRLQNETPEVGSSGIQEDINKLSDELSRLSEVQIKLSDELKSIQVESKKTDHTTEKLLKEKASTSAQRTNDEVYVERTEKLLRQKRTNYNQLVVEKTMLRLKLREAEKKLIAYTD